MRSKALLTTIVLAICLHSINALAARPDLSVMAYNIMQLPVQDWDQTARANALPDALRTLETLPDVIGFQEVFRDHAADQITGMSEYNYHTPILGKVCSGGGWDSMGWGGDSQGAGGDSNG